LIGLSVALKPLALLLPVALLLRRETRKAGAIAAAVAVALTVAGQWFLAWRAHDVSLLNPAHAYFDFARKTATPSRSLACHPGNIAPQGTSCRLLGTGAWS